MSNNYNNNKRFYQLVGWIGTGVCLFVGFLIYALIQFYAPLTYYHNKYYKLYRTSEQSSLVKQMKQKVRLLKNQSHVCYESDLDCSLLTFPKRTG